MPVPPDKTIFFDLRGLSPDDDELAARRALRVLRASYRNHRRRHKPSSPPPLTPPQLPAASVPESTPPPVPPPFAPTPAPLAPSPLKTRGAQPGNNNALKYGFYSRRIPSRDLEGLDQTAVTSLKDEIEVMRVFSRKVAELGSDVEELSDAKDLLRVLSLATTSINRLVRTHTRIPEPDLDPALLLKTALLELEEEWPELKKFASQYRNKPAPDQPPTPSQP